jgi:GTP-binding protein
MDQSDPIENYKTIRSELAHYSQELAERPEIVVVTKAELPDAADIHESLSQELERQDIHLVSAVTGSGLGQLVHRIADLLAEYRSASK